MRVGEKIVGFACISFISTLICASCGDLFNTRDYEIKKIKGAPNLDLPLANGTLVIQDILSKQDQANIKIYPDGLVYLLYDQTLKSQSIRDLLVFPTKSFTTSVPIPAATRLPRVTEIQYAALNINEDFAFSPEKLSEIKFKTTSLKVTVTFSPANPSSNTFEVQVKLPNFKLNGTAFQQRINASATGVTFTLSGYIATLVNNTFPLEIAVFEKPHAANVTVAPSTSATVKLDFVSIDFQYVKGFFGDQTTLNIPTEIIDFNAFGNALTKAKVSFADPKLSFRVTNDFGIPTKITFITLEARKKNGSKLPILLSPASPVSIIQPLLLGQSATTDVVITNAKPMINFVPDQLYYKISARINEGLVSGNNFCADTSKIRINFKAEIPLYGSGTGLVLADTFSVNLTNSKNSSIESATLVAKVSNELPLEAFIQFYLANEQTIIFDSLFTSPKTALVKSSTVNNLGELQSPGILNQEISIPKEKLAKLFDAKKLIVKAILNTTKDNSGNPIDVKFKSSYKMNVNFGLKAKLKLDYDL